MLSCCNCMLGVNLHDKGSEGINEAVHHLWSKHMHIKQDKPTIWPNSLKLIAKRWSWLQLINWLASLIISGSHEYVCTSAFYAPEFTFKPQVLSSGWLFPFSVLHYISGFIYWFLCFRWITLHKSDHNHCALFSSSFLFLYGAVNPSNRETHVVMCFDGKTNESEKRT